MIKPGSRRGAWLTLLFGVLLLTGAVMLAAAVLPLGNPTVQSDVPPSNAAASRAADVAESVRSGETTIPEGEVSGGWSALTEVERAAAVVYVSEQNRDINIDVIVLDLTVTCDHGYDVADLLGMGYETGYAVNLVSSTMQCAS